MSGPIATIAHHSDPGLACCPVDNAALTLAFPQGRRWSRTHVTTFINRPSKVTFDKAALTFIQGRHWSQLPQPNVTTSTKQGDHSHLWPWSWLTRPHHKAALTCVQGPCWSHPQAGSIKQVNKGVVLYNDAFHIVFRTGGWRSQNISPRLVQLPMTVCP